MNNKYFASLPTEEIGSHLVDRRKKFYEYLHGQGRFTLLRNVYREYHKPSLMRGEILSSGPAGEFYETSVNDFRNLVQHSVSMTIEDRPYFQPKASNTDVAAIKQTQLASGLLEYYMRTKEVEKHIKNAVESAIKYGEGFLYVTWDPNAPQGGDVVVKPLEGLDVIRDIHLREPNQDKWVIIRTYENKFDLAAEHSQRTETETDELGNETEVTVVDQDSEMYKAIVNCDASSNDIYEDQLYYNEQSSAYGDSDLVPVYWFYHKDTPAVPNGRMVKMIGDDIIVYDGPLAYKDLPVKRIAAGEETGSIFGYTNAFDVVLLQKVTDKLHSIILTNQATFGVQNIIFPKGSNLNQIDIATGLRAIEVDLADSKFIPQALSLVSTPNELFGYLGELTDMKATLMGINKVTQGKVDMKLSGSAMALLQQMAIQFSQTLQHNYAMALESLGTSILQLLQTNANTDRIALIAGKSNRSRLVSFKGEDLAEIQAVQVDLGNPIMKTGAGRWELAQMLIQNGLVQNFEEAINVLTAQRIEPLYEAETAELNLIRSENEALANGEEQPVIQTDDHEQHIREHKAVLSSPEARRDPAVTQATLLHIAKHNEQLALSMPQTPENDPALSKSAAGIEPSSQQPSQPSLPELPTNPLTGQQVEEIE